MSTQIGFNLFEMNTVGHISHGLWVHLANSRHRFNDLDFWIEEARLLEAGLFDAVFLADVIGTYDGYRGGPETALREGVQIPSNDPLLVIPAMAAVTRHLAFAATFSTIYEPPFALGGLVGRRRRRARPRAARLHRPVEGPVHRSGSALTLEYLLEYSGSGTVTVAPIGCRS